MRHDIQGCVASRLRALSRVVDGIYREQLKDEEITVSQLNILFLLYRTGRVEQSAICTFLHLERSTVSRNLRRLIEKGYVEKTGNHVRPVIVLTSGGTEKVEILLPKWERAMDAVYHRLQDAGLNCIEELERHIF